MVSLEGKDVWLVQVPAGFDASKATVKSESEILTADGVVYSLEPTFAPLGVCQILQGENEDGASKKHLHAISTRPMELMALTQTVAIPKVDYSKVIVPKPRVKQHQGLRLRHFPSGYGSSASQSSSKGVSKDKKALNSPIKAKLDETPSKHKKDKKSKKSKSEKKDKKDKKA